VWDSSSDFVTDLELSSLAEQMSRFKLKYSLMAGALALGVEVLQVSAAGPKIAFEKSVYDFGRISQPQSVNGVFAFQNTGDAPLILEKPTTSCGCAVASVEPESVPPGQKGEIRFTLDMPSVRSVLNKHIIVTSNDPKNPRIELTIKAEYVPVFEINPILVHVKLRQDQTTNVVFRLNRTDGKPLNLTSIRPSKPWINARLDTTEKSGATAATVRIEVKAAGEPRHFSEYVRLFADGSEEPVLSAVLMGQIVGDVILTPESLSWNLTDAHKVGTEQWDTMMTRRLTINCSKPGEKLQIRNATSTFKDLKIEIVPKEKEGVYELVAKLTRAPDTTLHGAITFETNLSSQPTVQVPFTIRLLKR
jgi:hypothetical protein